MNIEISNTPSVDLEVGQANVVELETGIAKSDSSKDNYMTYIDLSTDMENPTELFDYINKSGTYVAKNTGIIGIGGEPFTILAQGHFFEIQNFKDLAKVLGEEIPDEENEIHISIQSLEGLMFYLRITSDEIYDSINITTDNINDYVNIDTRNLVDKNNNINGYYGIFMANNYLAIMGASTAEINSGVTNYKPITPYNLDYALQQKGIKYFATKESLEEVQDNVDKLVTDIEAILETVVDINE